MRTVTLTCPSCGAQLDVAANGNNATCGYCGTTVYLDDGSTHVHHYVKYENAVQAGYDFERGRLRAREDYNEEKHGILWWLFGWVYLFPVPLAALLRRNKNMGKATRAAILAVAWLIYVALIFAFIIVYGSAKSRG